MHDIVPLDRKRKVEFLRVTGQEFQFNLREAHVGGQVRGFPAQQGQQHDALGNHLVDRDRTLQPQHPTQGQPFHFAFRLQHPEVLFDPPPARIV